MGSSDNALLQRWHARRDADAFAELVARHSGMVLGTCRRVLGNAADAEEVAQECFLDLAQSRAGLKSPGGWLHTVAVRRSLDRRKSEQRRRRREASAALPAASCDRGEWDEIRAHVDEAIDALPQELREPVVLRFLEGRTHDGVAERLNLPRSTAESRLNRGLQEIRRFLRKKGVVSGAVGLESLLDAHLAEAASAEFIAAAGKLALTAAKPAAGLLAGAFGTAAAAKAAVLGVAAVVVLTAAADGVKPRPPQPAAPVSAPASTVLATAPTEASEEAPVSTPPAPAEAVPAGEESAAPAQSSRHVARSGTASGTVLDRQGKPRPGIHVELIELSLAKDRGKSMETDAEGRYQFEGLKPYVSYELLALDRDLGFHRTGEFALSPGRGREADLRLGVGPDLVGQVLDADGKPAADADVKLIAYFSYEEGSTGSVSLVDCAITQADGQGFFRLRGVSPGEYRVRAEQDRLTNARHESEVTVPKTGAPPEVAVRLLPAQ